MVDPIVLQQITPRVTRFFGPRKQLLYTIDVFPNHAAAGGKTKQDQPVNNLSEQEIPSGPPIHTVTRSFEDLEHFRKSLLARLGGSRKAFWKAPCKCACHKASESCPFEVAKPFVERLSFSSLPLWTAPTEEHLKRRQQEMNHFLASIMALITKLQFSSGSPWASQCLFLQEIMDFLEIETRFETRMKRVILSHQRQMNLNGWKAHSILNFGVGIPV